MCASVNLFAMLVLCVSTYQELANYIQMLLVIGIVLSILSFIFSLVTGIHMDIGTYTHDWFKTQEQLEIERQKTFNEWLRANDMCKIIGDHEAIKMYEAAKKKQHEEKPILR